MGVNAAADALELINSVDTVVLAVKPNVFASLLPSVSKNINNKGTFVISIAAGKSVAEINNLLGSNVPVARVMPNINATVLEAMSAYCCNALVNDEQKALEVLDLDFILNTSEYTELKFLNKRNGSSDSNEYYDVETTSEGQHLQIETVNRHTISDDSIEDCERKVRISVFPFELSVYKDMDAFNKWAGFGDGKEVGNTGLKVGGFSETFAMPGGMFKEKADDESYSFLVGRVKSFRDVQVSFGEISWDFVLANVYTALGTVPVAMGREVFDLSALEPEVIVAMNADVKADMSKPEDFTYPKKQ